ncbi:ABC transporter ATP-binding protein [Vagococcus acidifermentans]|uniref:ABC transporter domain-containing protein n=1 Tax=Vagococcus acidifermentans TaxID=564710 RepID=A0A430APU6_9ENTE|nr:ABC transporter ATP-binding protein [Vagococcus acidifermentans]RSU09917.1 hypothetical protein CBF27_11495 [Vagococcus acidifermentans]
MIDITGVTKTFRGKPAVKNVSLSLADEECVGLIGPNGAGKTTLLKMLVDIIRADTGTIMIDGRPVAACKNDIGYLGQTPAFHGWLTGEDALIFSGNLSGLAGSVLQHRVTEVLHQVGLWDNRKRQVSHFSGGMKQRLGIAQAILHNPRFLVLDEPLSALDPIGRREVIHILTELKQTATIILSTHILNDAHELCERFCLMKKGQIIRDISSADFLERNGSNTIFIEFSGDVKQVLAHLSQLPFVVSAAPYERGVTVVLQEPLFKHQLLTVLLSEKIDLFKFEVTQDSLEDIFLKEVL